MSLGDPGSDEDEKSGQKMKSSCCVGEHSRMLIELCVCAGLGAQTVREVAVNWVTGENPSKLLERRKGKKKLAELQEPEGQNRQKLQNSQMAAAHQWPLQFKDQY